MISLLEIKGNSELFTVFLKVPSSQLPYHLSDTTVLGNLSAGEGGGEGGRGGGRRREEEGGGGGGRRGEEEGGGGGRRGGEGEGGGGGMGKVKREGRETRIHKTARRVQFVVNSCSKRLIVPSPQHAVGTFTR